MALETYFKEMRQRFATLVAEKPQEVTTHRCSICIGTNSVSLLHINKTQETVELLLSETFQFDEINNIPLILSGLVQQYSLQNIPTYWLLPPDEYQLFLIESLPVKAEEFQDALRWRIKSLLTYPIEEATIDYFQLPAKKSTPDHTMIAAVTARTTQLLRIIDILKKSNIDLTIIDIPELAMRNLTKLYENDEKSTAFIYFYDKIAILNISCQKTLFFTRRLTLANESELSDTHYEQLCLNLLRYFDYFQSQWRYPQPNRILIASEKNNTTTIAQKLSQNLSLNVEPLALKAVLLDSAKIQSLEKQHLLNVGCALREEQTYVASGN